MTDQDCSCRVRPGEDGRTWERDCSAHGQDAIMGQLLPVGTPIRNIRHPELTGCIKAHEWRSHDEISAIPYLIAWDDSSAAHSKLGMLHVYACVDQVERVSVSV